MPLVLRIWLTFRTVSYHLVWLIRIRINIIDDAWIRITLIVVSAFVSSYILESWIQINLRTKSVCNVCRKSYRVVDPDGYWPDSTPEINWIRHNINIILDIITLVNIYSIKITILDRFWIQTVLGPVSSI